MTFSTWVSSAMPATWTCSAPVAPPSTCSRSVHSCADGQSALRPRRYHPPKSRSALVVSHHLDGFLRFASRGLVASRCRSWGPSRFRTGRLAEGQRATMLSRNAGFEPFEEIPAVSRTASPRPLPSCRSPATTAPARSAPLPVHRLWRWEGRRRRLQGLAPSSGLVSVHTVAGVGDPLLPGLRSSSRSFPTAGDPVSHCRTPSPEPPRGMRDGKLRSAPAAPPDRSRTAHRAPPPRRTA